MGYYTKYSLQIEGAEKRIEPCAHCGGSGTVEIDELDDVKRERIYHTNTVADIGADGEWTWYDWKDDMKALSLKYPRLAFILDGDGEEQGDVWQATIKNGHIKMKRAKVELVEVEE